MKPFLKRILVYGALLLAAVFATWSLLPAATRGHLAAKIDTWRGDYVWFKAVHPNAPKYTFDQLLWDRYHIRVSNLPDDDANDRSVSEYFTAYDSVMWAAANQKFGLDVYEDCKKEVMRR